jgi:hypothetical protein
MILEFKLRIDPGGAPRDLDHLKSDFVPGTGDEVLMGDGKIYRVLRRTWRIVPGFITGVEILLAET